MNGAIIDSKIQLRKNLSTVVLVAGQSFQALLVSLLLEMTTGNISDHGAATEIDRP